PESGLFRRQIPWIKAEVVEGSMKMRGQGSLDPQRGAVFRMGESYFPRQEEELLRKLQLFRKGSSPAVFAVSQDWVPQRVAVRAELMGPSRHWSKSQPGHLSSFACHLHPAGEGRTCIGSGGGHLFALAETLLAERSINCASKFRWRTSDECPIDLARFILLETRAQMPRRLGSSRQKEDTRGIAVQAMYQARAFVRIKAEGVQHAVEAPAGFATTLDGQSCWPVEGDHPVVAKENASSQPFSFLVGEVEGLSRTGKGRLSDFCKRRNANSLPFSQAQAAFGALAIDPQLALSQHSFQPALGHLRKAPAEPAIETLIGLFRLDDMDLNHRSWRS